MAALDVGMYDNFVSNTLQSEISDLRVLDDNEVELVNGQIALPLVPIAAGAAVVIGAGVCIMATAYVIGFGIGYWMNRDPQPPPPPQPPAPPRPPITYWDLNTAQHNSWLSHLPG